MSDPITPITSFSISDSFSTDTNSAELSFSSVSDAFLAASAEADQVMDSVKTLASQGSMGPRELLEIVATMGDQKLRSSTFSHIVNEITKGFKTLTQQ